MHSSPVQVTRAPVSRSWKARPLPDNSRYARHIGIVLQLQSRRWVPASSLATRFGVSVRTIYRDIEQLTVAGLPVESVAGPEGGYRLTSNRAVDPLILDADDALRIYVLGLITGNSENGTDRALLKAGGVSAYARDTVRKLRQRIYFDTADWYWRDEGSGHIPAVRQALLTNTAVEITVREKQSPTTSMMTVKPYGLVWKGGEWWLVAAPPQGEPARYRLNHIDRLARTDLRFAHPEDAFDLQQWWTQSLEDRGRGTQRVALLVQPAAHDEMLRLGLKPDSRVEYERSGAARIVLYVDRWHWLVPLIASFGADVTVTEPEELRSAIQDHHRRALASDRYDAPVDKPLDFSSDDIRLRSTRGRNPRTTEQSRGRRTPDLRLGGAPATATATTTG